MSLLRAIAVSAMFMAALAAGCSTDRKEVGAEGTGTASRVGQLEAKQQTLEEGTVQLGRRLDNLEFQQTLLRSAAERYRTAVFDPSDKGYGRLDTGGGTFLLSVDDAKPYLDGFKLTLRIGNIQSIGYGGFVIKASWGAKWDGTKLDYAKWRSSLKSKEFKMPDHLNPGAWNRIELALAPAKAEEIRFIEIEMTTDVVQMLQAR
jgi:hypothetical protein